MNETNLSLDHGLHSGAWDPSTADGTNTVLFHVHQALAAVDFLRARARATISITDSASAPAERGQALPPSLRRDASGLGQKSARGLLRRDEEQNRGLCVRSMKGTALILQVNGQV